MINQYKYRCPHCDKKLNKNKHVDFIIRRENGQKATLSLDPQPRTYNFKCIPEINFKKGEIIDFFCPYCDKNLESKTYSKFVELHLNVTKGVVFKVFFSRIYGAQETYVGIEDFEEEYGEKISKY